MKRILNYKNKKIKNYTGIKSKYMNKIINIMQGGFKMKKYVLIVFIIATLALSGCGGEDDVGSTTSPYEGGSQGIIASFESFGVVEDGIPVIYEDETFPVEITVKNKGEELVGTGTINIELKGISQNDFSGLEFTKSNSGDVDAVSELNREGGEETIDFGDAQYTVELQTSYYDVEIFANIKYPYKTHIASPKICFSGDITDTSVCKVDEVKQHYSSGAPVTVTKVEEKRAGKGLVALEYTIQNVGGGEMAKEGAEFGRYDEFTFSLDDTSDPSAWDCTMRGQKNEGRLTDGAGTIICKLITPLSEDEMYTKQIDLTLSYDYRYMIQEGVRIKSKG